MSEKNKSSSNRVNGDSFIICNHSLFAGIIVIDSNNSLSELMKKLPEALANEEESLSVCAVDHWIASESDPSDSTPKGIRTLFEVEPHDIDECDLT